MKPIYLIVLAAGLSSRFGRNKLIEEVGGVPIVARVVRAGQEAGLKNTVVVTGHERERVLEALCPLRFEEVHNPDYFQGMSTSIRAGVAQVRDKARAMVISPGDMAFTEARLFDAVLAEFARSPNDIVVASFRGRSGHPILFNETTFDDLMQITEEKRGMKEVVQGHKEHITYVETSTSRALLDIDFEEDFARAARELELEKNRK